MKDINQIRKSAIQADLVPSEIVLKLLDEHDSLTAKLAKAREALLYYEDQGFITGSIAREALKEIE